MMGVKNHGKYEDYRSILKAAFYLLDGTYNFPIELVTFANPIFEIWKSY